MPGLTTHSESLELIRGLGFPVNPNSRRAEGIEAVIGYVEEWADARKALDYETDGIVIKVDSVEQQQRLGFVARAHILGQEDHAAGVLARGWEVDSELRALFAEEAIGRADEDAGAVAGIDFAAAGTAVVHVLKHLQCIGDDAMRRLPLHVADEADAAGVMLESGVVQALCGR